MNLSRKTARGAAAASTLAIALGAASTVRAADDAKPAAKPAESHLGPQVAAAYLNLDPTALAIENLRKNHLGYMPNAVPLTETKPAGVVKAPAFAGTARYGIVTVGNGPNKETFVAVDDIADGGAKLYVDANHDGDLTNDGDSAFGKETVRDGIRYYGVTPRAVRASYADPASPSVESASAGYTLGFYYTAGGTRLSFYAQTGRVGILNLDGKPIPVLLTDSYSDGVFDRSIAASDDRPARPVALYSNIAVGGAEPVQGVTPQRIDVSKPFRLNGKVYEAKVSADGSKIALFKTDAKVPETPKPAPRPPILAAGKTAPDFTAYDPDGKPVKLSDFKGKVVILDFWATWCGPCQHSMPHLEEVYKQVKDRSDVVVLAVCVWDDKAPFDNWVKANIGTKYTFPVAFDTAARDTAKSIARDKFGVSGIPTQFVIGKDGKVAAGNVGYSDGDHRLEKALAQAGIPVTETPDAAKTASAQ